MDTNLRAARVYPTEDSTKAISELKTVGIKLTRDQALHLARVLLSVTEDWDDVDITGIGLNGANRTARTR